MRMLFSFLVLGLAGASNALDIPSPPPTAFALYANDPNPFCPERGATVIRFDVPQACDAELRVRDSGNNLVRTLYVGPLAVGYHQVAWDGRDDGAVILPDGMYPYQLIASVGGQVVFTGTQTAELSCIVGVETSTWSRIKALYGGEEDAATAERSR